MLLLSFLRGLHDAAMMSAFGTLVFAALVGSTANAAPAPEQHRVERHVVRQARCSAGLGLLAGAAWFVAATAEMAGVTSAGAIMAFIPIVVLQTQFGRWLALRLALLLLVVALLMVLRWSSRLARAVTPLSLAVVAIQPMLGHPGAENGALGRVLVANDAVHLIAAGAWAGALLPLWGYVRHLPSKAAAQSCTRFSRLGLTGVCLIAATGLVLAIAFIGTPHAAVDTRYGELVLLKSMLFALALLLASLNRFVLGARLDRSAEPSSARRALLLSIGTEAVVGLAIVLAAGFVAGQVPSVDLHYRMP